MTAAQPVERGTSWHSGTSLTPEVWWCLLDALNAGTPPYAACLYAGISPAAWEREKQRIPEFADAANRVEWSGYAAAWRFLQGAAATEWRASLELIKLFGATHGRDAARVDEPGGDDDLNSEVTPDDVAAVIRFLRAHDLADHAAGEPAPDGHSNGRAAR